MKFTRAFTVMASVAVTIAACVAVNPATAYDGLDPQMARELASPQEGGIEGSGVSQAVHSSNYVGDDQSEIQQVGFHSMSPCDGCGMSEVSCGCESSQSGGILFQNQPKRRSNGRAGFGSGGCNSGSCAPPWWAHRNSLFGEFLWLRPGSSDLIYATEQTDPDPTVASPTGPLGITDLDAEGGFRVGFSHAASDCSSLVTTYTRWDGETNNHIRATGGNVLGSNVIHPSTATSGAASNEATAQHRMNFQTVDVQFRRLWKRSNSMALNWLAGVRYGNMEQLLSVDQTVSVATGLTNVSTDIDFDGFGITGGLDFQTYSCTTGLALYGKALASLMAGEWNASYDQTNQFGGGVISNRYEDFHATPVLEAELGVRWMSANRKFVASTGFMMSGWYETVTTRNYINAVRAGQLTDAGETMTFSGLTAGVTYRF